MLRCRAAILNHLLPGLAVMGFLVRLQSAEPLPSHKQDPQNPHLSVAPALPVEEVLPGQDVAPVAPQEIDAELIITSVGENTIEGGVFTARDSVELLYGRVSLYADEMSYDMTTGWASATGNVRLFRGDGTMLTGPAMSYNTRTGEVRAESIRGVTWPFVVETDSVKSEPRGETAQNTGRSANGVEASGHTSTEASTGQYLLGRSLASTENKQQPGFRVTARSVHHSPAHNRTIFRGVTMYAGKVPIMWWPRLTYEPGGSDFALQATPGYNSEWGAFLLLAYGLEVRPGLYTKPRLDYRTQRGVAGGLDTHWFHGKRLNSRDGERGQGFFNFYIADDTSPVRVPEDGKPNSRVRYRLTARERYYFNASRDLYLSLTADVLRDATVVRDFFPNEYVLERQPDNHAELVKRWPEMQASLLVRPQVNAFFETVERLPEVRLDLTRQQLFTGLPLYYASQSSLARLQRRFATNDRIPSPVSDYNATRLDTYQELSVPLRLARVLNLVTAAGWRGTWYDDSLPEFRTLLIGERRLRFRDNVLVLDEDTPIKFRRIENTGGAPVGRSVFALNIEGSTKLSRTYNWNSERWGIQGLRHVVEPWFHFSYIPNPVKSTRSRLMLFDERFGTTRPNPLSFPQYNSVDDISSRLTLRLGLNQRFQTLRDGRNHNLLILSTYIDVDPDQKTYSEVTSNLFNEVAFSPVPWLSLLFFGSSDLHSGGYHEYNTALQWQIARPLAVRLSHRFLDNSSDFRDSNQVSMRWMWRIDDNWFFSTRHVFELLDPGVPGRSLWQDLLRTQEYTISRDLTSWRASLTARWDNNRLMRDEFSVYLTLTLKAFPDLNIPLNYSFDDGQAGVGF